MIAVELRQVSKCFGDVHAVRDVTLSVAAGERLAVVGPSGCGKTTLLRLIAGLESPDRGEVAFDGRVVNAVPPHQRGVAMVFQNYALYPHMTVYDNLGFGLRCRRVARRTIRARIREVAERLRIADILHRRPAELSGGQRQRVALGRAWVGEAGVLLLDEPMSHLDAQHRERMRRELLTHLDQGPVTTLYVTHDQEEALALGQRVAVMNAGGLQQVGTPAEVYRYPANRFVAEFLGMPTMNFIEGEIVRGSAESLCFRTLDGDLPLPDSARSLKLSAPALVVLGVRPQDLHFTRQTSIPGLPFYVEAMAFQGSQTLVYLKTPQGTPLTLCAASDTQLQVGQRGICTPVMDRIHLFAPGPFGENLLPPTHPVP